MFFTWLLMYYRKDLNKMKVDTNSIYKLITTWERDLKEMFIDYFSSQSRIKELAEWCLNKDYITGEQFNNFIVCYLDKYTTIDNLLYDNYDFCVCQWNEDMNDEQCDELEDKALKILAEFLSEHENYIKKVILFAIGKDWSTNYVEINGETEEQELNRGIKEFKRYYQEYLDDGDFKIEFE